MKKWILIIISVFTGMVNAATSPLPMLESAAYHITQSLQQHRAELKSNPQFINQAIRQYLLPHVDVIGMSRSVLGRNLWMQATPQEKLEFTQEFTSLVIRTYASPLSDYAGETIKFIPLRDASNARFVRVNSIISRLNGQKISLSYHLVLQQNEWKIYDLSVEGVSLLHSFRTQFGQMLQHATMHELITTLRKDQ